MGHAVCAYLGDIAGYEYIWQAINDPCIKEITEKAMRYSGMALEKIYGDFDYDYIDDLIRRFANKALGDTVSRVGADLKRKLAPDDRITGVLKLMITHDMPVKYMCLTIAAAVNFKHDKLTGQTLGEILKEAGSYNYIAGNPDAFRLILKLDKAIKSSRMSIKDLAEKFL
jgi:mannitol-1-phosphate 5-dehydrogenase